MYFMTTGYSPIGYLCEHILNICDVSHADNQSLEHIFKLINLIVERCPSDELSNNFHIMKTDIIGENLLLHVHNKLDHLPLPIHIKTLFHRLQPIIIGTDRDHQLFAERLLELCSWKSAINALCNTDNVNVSNALIQCIVRDPHVLLTNNHTTSTDPSIVCVLIFYALTTNRKLLQNMIPVCNSVIKDEQQAKRTIDNHDESMRIVYNISLVCICDKLFLF